jgi:hypothetical protein
MSILTFPNDPDVNDTVTINEVVYVWDGNAWRGSADVLVNKQEVLVSGTNIKTINNQSILGSGNITIEGGGGAIEEVGTDSLSSTGLGAGTSGTNNNFFGFYAGASNTTGNSNTFFGYTAGCNNTTGNDNNFFGRKAGVCNTEGNNNNFFGAYAGFANTGGYVFMFGDTGNDNNFFGRSAGFSNNGNNNNFFGLNAGFCNTSGSDNTFIGFQASTYNTEGSNNISMGSRAGFSNTTGCYNTFFGRYAGRNNTTGSHNNFNGCSAGCANTTGCNNTFFGRGAGQLNTTGSNNFFVGLCAGQLNTTGSTNLFLGRYAGLATTTGSNNIFFGHNAGRTSVTPSGLACITTECNRIIMGNADHTCAQIQIAWTTVSDARDKCIYGAINRGLGFLKNVNPIEFAFKDRITGDLKDPAGKRRYGFSAQDILALEGDQPVIVSTENPEQLQMTNDHLIPILVNAVKELSAQVDELKFKLDQLAP